MELTCFYFMYSNIHISTVTALDIRYLNAYYFTVNFQLLSILEQIFQNSFRNYSLAVETIVSNVSNISLMSSHLHGHLLYLLKHF